MLHLKISTSLLLRIDSKTITSQLQQNMGGYDNDDARDDDAKDDDDHHDNDDDKNDDYAANDIRSIRKIRNVVETQTHGMYDRKR